MPLNHKVIKKTSKYKLITLVFGLVLLGLNSFQKVAAAQQVPVYSYKIVKSYPHDPMAFTQGLFFKGGDLYESTGHYGQSSIRKIDLETGRVIQKKNLPDDIFGEGIVSWGNRIIGLTWKNSKIFEWDSSSFNLTKTHDYTGQGWGLTHNNKNLILSDGTSILKILDPITLEKVRDIPVTINGNPIANLNELEWVGGEIYANIWQTNYIARIDPENGHIIGWINLRGLLTQEGPVEGAPDVLNGIAIDASGRLFVTGKYWPKLFEIELIQTN